MNYSITPHSLIGHLLPGLVFVLALLGLMYGSHLDVSALTVVYEAFKTSIVALASVFLLLAWFVGLFVDAVRNAIIEPIWDRISKFDKKSQFGINWWDVFFKGEEQTLKNLNDHYYSYYVLDINLGIVNFVLFIYMAFLAFSLKTDAPKCLLLLPIIFATVFFYDAGKLRREIVALVLEYLKNMDNADRENLPHHEVYTRLGASKTHGVGVFAIRDIPKDTEIFYGDDTHMEWIDKNKLDDLPAEVKKLYEDFGVIKDGKYGCPKNFNTMTISWYLNSSKTPNVRCGENYQFYALQDIKKGDELTVDYDTYSD